MKIIWKTLKGVLFWSYDRGTWQYDIMCVLILAFIFFGPNSVFRSKASEPATVSSPQFVTREEVGQPDQSHIEEEVTGYLSRKYGRQVTVSRIEPMMDQSGNVSGYLATVK